MKTLIVIICLAVLSPAVQSKDNTKFDLGDLYKKNKVTVVNRSVISNSDPSRSSLTLSEEVDEGLVWIDGVSFSTGTIEIDLKGQDVYQHSFVGIAFHGINDSTFDAVYFRPFQFITIDSVRKTRGVQYISLPEYTWQKLRAERPAVFEKTVAPPPDPNDWFHAKIVVTKNEVMAYVNNASVPSLQVNLLGKKRTGKIALYTGDRSGGSFANLSIKKN